jgi:Ca2+/Na+ antiporter
MNSLFQDYVLHNLSYSVTGHGSMGISNSIGSNTFNILLCLGLPWLIKCSFLPAVEGQHYVGIHSSGIGFSAISLLSALLLLYTTFLFSKFKLDRKVGVIFLCMYAVFLTISTLIELNTFVIVNLPVCGQGH